MNSEVHVDDSRTPSCSRKQMEQPEAVGFTGGWPTMQQKGQVPNTLWVGRGQAPKRPMHESFTTTANESV